MEPSIVPKGRSSEEEEADEVSSGSATLLKIQSIKKTRRLKSLQRRVINETNKKNKKNNRAGKTGGGDYDTDDDDAKKEDLAREANKDLKERLEGTFATNKRAGGRGGGGGADGDDEDEDIEGDQGTMQRKHKLAMEQYIENQMDGEVGSGKIADATNGDGSSSNSVIIQDQSALYAQLIREATMTTTEGGGSSTTQTATSTSGTTGAGTNSAGGGTKEGDVGAGGAMLGGTGIAEVVLPVEERIQTAKNTELAASQLNRRWAASRRIQGGICEGKTDDTPLVEGDSDGFRDYLPTNFGQGPGKKRHPPSPPSLAPPSNRPRTALSSVNEVPKTEVSHHGNKLINREAKELPSFYSASSAGNGIRSEDVSHIGASYAHNYSLHTNEWISNKKREQQVEIDAINKEKEEQEGTGLNRMRVGFEAKRGLQPGGNGSNRAATGTEKGGPQFQAGFRGGRGGRGGSGGRGRARDNQAWKNFIHKERDRGLNR